MLNLSSLSDIIVVLGFVLSVVFDIIILIFASIKRRSTFLKQFNFCSHARTTALFIFRYLQPQKTATPVQSVAIVRYIVS